MSKLDYFDLNLAGVTIQRFLIEALRDEGAVYSYDPGGTSLQFEHDGYQVTFNGVGLVGTDVSFGGKATDFVIEGKGGSVTGLFVVAPEYNALYQAAEAGSGLENPENYAAFYDLFVPAGHFLIVNGDRKPNTAEGSTGDDIADLGRGNDAWIAGPGADTVEAGAGDDYTDCSELTVSFAFNMKTGVFTYDGATAALTGFENAGGSAFDDAVTGSNRANWLFGVDGNDTLKGQGGDDWIDGGNGRDRLYDGLGSDWFFGGKGADRFNLFGPEAGHNVIADFEAGRDTVNFRAFGFTMPSEVMGRASQAGADVVVDYGLDLGGGSLTIKNATIEDLGLSFTF